ncbi:hypothetical protein RFI_15354 [Reticulomyxa filosa]|uniref:Photosynthesis system II assembly factor Ycf48/Hcf136-like domain-containing protein n=1 Tax=Reticulomyxa filosa TaxID=46433 RepID=X6N7W8_RETFI|nr:hypothetical protein RFI_15354 [Reticulomyxa filosa]|eukprot:ETO21849.1 hypothetical protein RFI_15354 [Reticulomyxa filosa]
MKHALNSKVELWYSSQSKRSRVHFKGFKHSGKRHHGPNKRKLSQSDAIWGAIYKTSDAGQSWTQVYESYGDFYFNAIDCCTEDLCYAVAEGDSDAGSSNPGTRILQTQDGGQTWNIVYFNALDGASLMAVHCVDSNNAWAAGGTIIERDFHGDFLYTSNNGGSWTDFQVNVPILYMDMSDDSSTGMASGLTKSGEGVAFGFK